MHIAVKNLYKSYNNIKILNNLNFNLQENQITGLIGPNGAGKSTTFKILMGLKSYDKGSIEIAGKPIKKQMPRLKKKMGLLLENNPLYDLLYVKEYLEICANIHQIKNKGERVHEVMEQVGLFEMRKRKIKTLSKGYKQRVGLAQAIIHKPSFLILDEPTSGLDPNQIIEIRDIIKQLGKSTTVLLSSHILNEVKSICEKIIIIDKGNIVFDDYNKKNQHSIFKIKVVLKEGIQADFWHTIKDITVTPTLRKNEWIISSKKDKREAIFNHCTDTKNPILSLTEMESNNIEKIFRKLTH